ncbi:MAG TPA: flavodoxin domain-containing protein [Acidimicrobiia bacterium]
MRALVVYESMYGNTHTVAGHIADGLRPTFDVEVVAVGEATPERAADVDLLIVGGPTHAHGMSTHSTRSAAVAAAEKEGAEIELDAAAMGPGLREWFRGLGERTERASVHTARAAVFDTRFDLPSAFTGRAGRGIGRRLRRHGFELIVGPESFFVDKQNHLEDGEAERAIHWGAALAQAVCPASA